MITPDAVLNILGILLGLVGIWSDLFKKQRAVIIVICSVIGLLGYSLLLEYEHEHEISQTENEIKRRLANNRWTAERLLSEMGKPDYKVFHEALSRSVASGAIGDQRTSCMSSAVTGGDVLDTKIYYFIHQ